MKNTAATKGVIFISLVGLISLFVYQFYFSTNESPSIPEQLVDEGTKNIAPSNNDNDTLEERPNDAATGDDESDSADTISIGSTLNGTAATVVKIKLDSSNTSVTQEGIQVNDQTITITQAGNYEFTGTLSNGQIVVDTDDEDDVQIILNNVSITNSTTSTIFIENAEQTVIHLADTSINTLIDSDSYENKGEDDSNATIYSRDDLVIRGEGILNIQANYNDGITSKDDLVILGGEFTITAKDDGIRGKDSLRIENGIFDITAGGDAIKTDNEDEGLMEIQQGVFELAAGDDAIHSEVAIVIDDGEFVITEAFEGIESQSVTINGGTFSITTSDDGINAGGGDEKAGDYEILITGGDFRFNTSGGDSIDSNDIITITGGSIIVDGAERGGVAFDFVNDFSIAGGEILATGSGSREVAGSPHQDQNTLFLMLNTVGLANSLVSIQDDDGNEIISTTPTKTFKYIISSHPSFEQGQSYTYLIDGEMIGEVEVTGPITQIGSF